MGEGERTRGLDRGGCAVPLGGPWWVDRVDGGRCGLGEERAFAGGSH